MKLVKFREADEALYARLVFNEETMKMNLGRTFTPEEAGMFFRAMLAINASQGRLGFYQALVQQRDGDVFIGMGALTMNEEFKAAEIEYMLLPEYWRHGYGTELTGMLLKMAADARLSGQVIAITDPANLPSKRILAKYGFEWVKRYQNDDGEPVELYARPVGGSRADGGQEKKMNGGVI